MGGETPDPFELVASLIGRVTDPSIAPAERSAAGRALGGLPVHMLRLLNLDALWAGVMNSLEGLSGGAEGFVRECPPAKRASSIRFPVYGSELHRLMDFEWSKKRRREEGGPGLGVLPVAALELLARDEVHAETITDFLKTIGRVQAHDPLPGYLAEVLADQVVKPRRPGGGGVDRVRVFDAVTAILDRWRERLLFAGPVEELHLRVRLEVARWVRQEEVLDPAVVRRVDFEVICRFLREVGIADVRRLWHESRGDVKKLVHAGQIASQCDELLFERALSLVLEGRHKADHPMLMVGDHEAIALTWRVAGGKAH